MVAVERLEDQHLVTGIEQGHGGGVEASAGAGGDQNFAFRVVVEGVVALLLDGDGRAQASDAVQAGVDVVAVVDGLDGRLLHRRRDRRVADALREIDAADPVALDAHGANLRLHGGWG